MCLHACMRTRRRTHRRHEFSRVCIRGCMHEWLMNSMLHACVHARPCVPASLSFPLPLLLQLCLPNQCLQSDSGIHTCMDTRRVHICAGTWPCTPGHAIRHPQACILNFFVCVNLHIHWRAPVHASLLAHHSRICALSHHHRTHGCTHFGPHAF